MKKEKNKIVAALTNNIGLKILAVFIAAIVWLAVINVNDPEKTVTIYSIPVTITDEEVITDLGMVYSVETNQYINVTVTGRRSEVTKLTAGDFVATASLNELSKVNSIPVDVKFRKNSLNNRITINSQSEQTLKIKVEEIKKETYDVSVQFIGDIPNGYLLHSYDTSINKIDVKAPESIQKKIDKVVVNYKLSDSTSDETKKCKVILLDDDDNIINNNNVKLSNKKIDVSIVVYKTKSIGITAENMGNVQSGYQLNNISLSPEKVSIAGREDKLSQIDSIDISELIDISNIVADTTEKIDIGPLLPDGVYLEGSGQITVTIGVSQLSTKSVSVNAKDISIDNLGEGLELEFVDSSVNVTVRGENSGSLSEKDMSAHIDVTGLKKGTHTVDVTFNNIDGIDIISNSRVKVKIK